MERLKIKQCELRIQGALGCDIYPICRWKRGGGVEERPSPPLSDTHPPPRTLAPHPSANGTISYKYPSDFKQGGCGGGVGVQPERVIFQWTELAWVTRDWTAGRNWVVCQGTGPPQSGTGSPFVERRNSSTSPGPFSFRLSKEEPWRVRNGPPLGDKGFSVLETVSLGYYGESAHFRSRSLQSGTGSPVRKKRVRKRYFWWLIRSPGGFVRQK
jgi:hypothetical protein